jgi:pectate lyase
MKLLSAVASLLVLGQFALAAPSKVQNNERSNVVKRATITDTPTTGYATQNGG